MHVFSLRTLGLAAAMLSCASPLTVQAAEPGALIWADNMSPGADPHAVYDTPMWFIANNLYDNLYRYKGNPPNLVPWLAQSHEVSQDGLTWVFKLRPDVKFHDGTTMTAEDVAYSFQRVLGIGKGAAGAFLPVLKSENVKVEDPATVSFKLERPFAPFLSTTAMVPIVNAKLVKSEATADDPWATKWLADNDAGSGAYMLTPGTFESMVKFDYDRFPGHFMGWNHNSKPIEKVKARYIRESSTRVNALIRGDIDAGTAESTVDEVERMEASGTVNVHKDPVTRLMLITMNTRKAPLDNIDVRKCFSYAFNYDAYINGMLKGLATRSKAPIPDAVKGYPAGLEGYTYNPDKAKEFCDKARAGGADLETPLKLFYFSDGDQTLQAAQLFQSDLRRVGVNITLVPSIFARIVAETGKPETTPDMWVHWISPYFVDPDNWIGQMYDSSYQGTWKASSWYSTPELDQILREARESSDEPKRVELYEKAARMVVDAAPEIYVYNQVAARGLSKRVQNYTFSPIGYGGEVRYMSLAD